jgi:plastocyanin
MPINFPSSPSENATYSSGDATWIFDGTVWDLLTASSQVVISTPNTFSTVAVAGQSNVVADSSTDTLTLVAGSNVTLTTDPSSDSITITSTASGGGGGTTSNSFANIAVAGQSTVVADSDTDTLTLVGSGITITTNAGTDTITFTSSAASTFEGLTEVALGSFRIDQVYMPAITMLTVSNSGAVAYLFDQYSGSNPTIYAIGGTTIAFKLQVTGHPFLIQDGTGTNYNTGLFHVALNGAVSTGVNAQGQTQGTLYWKVPASISGGYRYLCSLHPIMVGAITVKNIVSL